MCVHVLHGYLHSEINHRVPCTPSSSDTLIMGWHEYIAVVIAEASLVKGIEPAGLDAL